LLCNELLEITLKLTGWLMKRNNGIKWYWLCLFFGSGYWLIEAARDSFVFDKFSFIQSVLYPDAMTFWIRFLAVCVITLLAVIAHSQFTYISVKHEHKDDRKTLPILACLLICVLYWLLESVRDYFLHNNDYLFDAIFLPDQLQVWSRTLPICMLILLGLYAYTIITRQLELQRKLFNNETRLTQILNQMPYPIEVFDKSGRLTMSNQAANILFHQSIEKINGFKIHVSQNKVLRMIGIEKTFEKALQGQIVNLNDIKTPDAKSKTSKVLRLTIFPVFRPDDSIWRIVAIWTDITEKYRNAKERQRLLNQLNHARNMESVGSLAGGIAHEFNNMMTAILGTVDLATFDLEDQMTPALKPILYDLQEIRKSSERAAALTKKLQLLGRKHIMERKEFNINPHIKKLKIKLGYLIKKNVTIDISLEDKLKPVYADPHTIEQVLLELVLNGSEAMPQGGMLKIITSNCTLSDESEIQHTKSQTGEFVSVEIHDNGLGIPVENLKKIFDPFFTTKSQFTANGLGLSMAYGILQQHHGWITVKSKIGEGSMFKIFLPAKVNPSARNHSTIIQSSTLLEHDN